ncbi:MAG: phage holin family protein [Capnocytophaga sp.]|nr:phage holin family protein [Capnocytophaga sp.]
MAFGNLKDNFEALPHRAEEVAKSNIEYYKLFVFRFIAKSSYGLLEIFIFGLVGLLVFFFVSFAIAFGVGQWIGNTALGFLIAGLFFVLLAAVIYALRRKLIERPLLRKLSEIYYKDDHDEDDQ